MSAASAQCQFPLLAYPAVAFFLCLGSLFVGFEVIGAVHEDAIVTIHVMSVEMFSCADMCYAEEVSYLGSSHVNMSQETLWTRSSRNLCMNGHLPPECLQRVDIHV